MEFKARNNDSLKKNEVLEMLNSAVTIMAPSAKVNLTSKFYSLQFASFHQSTSDPEITIFVQLVRKTLMVGAVRNFYQKRKNNMRPKE